MTKDKLSVEQIHRLLLKARAEAKPAKNYNYPIQRPSLMPGVVPRGRRVLVAADSGPYASCYDYARSMVGWGNEWVGFPGYPYLAGLSTRAEFRMFAQSTGTQLTREWIVLNSTDTAGTETKQKCTELTQMMTDLGLKECVELLAEHESFYGRAQMFLNLGNQDRSLPLILSPKTIEKKTLKDGVSFERNFRISAIEALWTTPNMYNALDPAAPDFYKPTKWWMLGQEVHATRLPTIVTRPVSDMLKPAFNFGGMSMSQLAEPYVDNWLRTRQSVSDLINNFSIVNLGTDTGQVLQGKDDGNSLFDRAELFTLTRSNRGLMITDKERETLEMLNAPLGGLSELQSQSQEQMCSVSHTPAVILLGIAPSGFGNVAEGEIRAYYDWLAAIQEAFWRKPIERVLNILQLIRYGVIDPDIVMTFQPLYQMTPKELSEIRKSDADRDAAYVDAGILDVTEIRERIARDSESGYQGIDTGKVPGADSGEEDEQTNNFAGDEWNESDHPRAANGEFGKGSGNLHKDAESLLKKEIKWSSSGKKNAQLAVNALNEIGFRASTENPSGRKTEGRYAAIGSPTNGILVNPRSPFWKNPIESAKQNFEHGHLSTEHPLGVLLHEMTHVTQKQVDNWFTRSHAISAAEVSRYASMNPKEFVAETFAGLKTGKTYSSEVMRIFKEYVGEIASAEDEDDADETGQELENEDVPS